MPIGFDKKNNKLTLEFDTSNLSPAQVRLIRSINAALGQVIAAENEGEYFEGSAEFMRLCASLIQQAHFTAANKESDIPYADQVLEYSMDILQEHMHSAKVVSYDN